MTDTRRAVLRDAQWALGGSQRSLGEAVGLSKRTIMRWQHGSSTPSDIHLHMMARLIHPTDRALAARIAAATGSSLVQLGLEPAAGSDGARLGPPMTPARAVESLVYAAAEAADVSPRVVRTALVAAIARAHELELDWAVVEKALKKKSS